MARDRTGRARRRAEGHRQEDRPADDGAVDRCVAGRKVRARDADDRSRSRTTCPSAASARSKRSGTADGKVLAKLSDRPINLGVQDDTQPPADPPAAGGGRGGAEPARASARFAWRADGQGLTYLEQEPPPAGQGSGRGRAVVAPAVAPAPMPRQTTRAGRGARAPERKDRLYQWLAPFDDASQKVLFESNTRMTGLRFSPDMKMIFFSERAGQNTVDYAVDLAEPAQRYTLARYRFDDVYANPGSIVGVRGGGGGGGRGAGGGRGGGGGGRGPVLLSADGTSVFFQGIDLRSQPERGRPEDLHRQGRDQDAARRSASTRARTTTSSSASRRRSTLDAGRFIVAREGPKTVPQHYLVQNGTRTQLTQNRDYTPDVTNARRRALRRRACRRLQVPRDGDAAAGLSEGHAAAGDLLVLPARVPGSGGVRSPRSHVQQELVPGLRPALDGVLRPPRLRGRRTRFTDRRPGRGR